MQDPQSPSAGVPQPPAGPAFAPPATSDSPTEPFVPTFAPPSAPFAQSQPA